MQPGLRARQALCISAAASALALGASPALAQPASNPAPTAEVGEVIVTARQREETLRDVPAQVTAFTSATLEAKGVEMPRDFINAVPNMTLVETQNSGNAFVVIRGISQARNSEPSVAVVVDGVPQTQPAQFNQELFDIEQIEVVKGPQGALYGRNAIGGAILITTKAPSDQFQGRITVGGESGPGGKVQGVVSGPVSDVLRYRASASYTNTSGHIENTYLHSKADPATDLNLRLKLLYRPNDRFSADLRLSADRLWTQALYFNITPDVNDTSLDVRVNNPGKNNRALYDASLKMDYQTDAGTFTSISGYSLTKEVLTGDAFDFLPTKESFFFNLFESIFGPGNGFDLNQSQFLRVRTLTQELRFTSPSDQRIRWIAGGQVFATRRYISTGNMIDTGNGVFPVFYAPSTNPLNPQFSYLADSQNNLAWAAYIDTSTSITDQLELSLNLRYDRDRRKNTTLTPTAFLPNVAGFPQGFTGQLRSHTWDDWQPQAILRFKATKDLNLYASYSRGFRSGGFNQTGVGAVAFANGFVGVGDLFDAETADAFEAGFKSRSADGRVALNGSVYTTRTKGSYFFVFLAANSTQNLGNIGEVRYSGFDLDVTARPTDRLTLTAGFGYTDSNIRKFPDPTVIGNEAPLVSRYTFNAGLQYRAPLAAGLDSLIRVDYTRTGKTWWEPYNTTVRKPVNLVNARVGLEGDNWSLTAWAKNLFNETYNAEFSPGGFVFKALPRRWGVDLTRRF